MPNARQTDMTAAEDPHAGQRVLSRGMSVADARLAVILVHGRGGSPEDIVELADGSNGPRAILRIAIGK